MGTPDACPPCSLAGMMPWESQLRVVLPGCQFYCRKQGKCYEELEQMEWQGGRRVGRKPESFSH